ncbi:TetR family transcriptional regulator, partial [Streptomyces sp. NPDC002586]
MSEPQQDRSRATKDKLLYGAACAFADLGYSASIRDFTKYSGVKHGAIYHHFGTKDDIGWEVVRLGAVKDESGSEPHRVLPTAEFSWVQMVVDQSGRLAAMTEKVPYIRAAHRLATEPGTPFYQVIWQHFQPEIIQILLKAYDEGELLPGIDAVAMAKDWIAAFTGYDLMRRLDPENLPMDIYELNRNTVERCVRPKVLR